MRKRKWGLYLGFFLLASMLMTGCSMQKSSANPTTALKADGYLARANQLIALIHDENWEAIASDFVAANRGVRFSPYASVRVDKDVTLTAIVLKKAFASPTVYTWGDYDGSGMAIKLTFAKYVEKFVNDADYPNADVIGNNTVIGTGNSKNNVTTAYPKAKFVEYHFKGFDPQYGGMDWKSIRLVLEPIEGKWMLVGIIHDQWTM